MSEATTNTCPHCGMRLLRFELPDAFDHAYDMACFNDDCPYYVRGWSWMEERFGVRSSYRYRVDGQTGQAMPIPVWSPTALRSSIVHEDAPACAAPKEHS
jgi:hypothetical protein